MGSAVAQVSPIGGAPPAAPPPVAPPPVEPPPVEPPPVEPPPVEPPPVEPPPVVARSDTVTVFVAVPWLPAASVVLTRTSKAPGAVNVWFTDSPVAPAVLSPKLQSNEPATPQAA